MLHFIQLQTGMTQQGWEASVQYTHLYIAQELHRTTANLSCSAFTLTWSLISSSLIANAVPSCAVNWQHWATWSQLQQRQKIHPLRYTQYVCQEQSTEAFSEGKQHKGYEFWYRVFTVAFKNSMLFTIKIAHAILFGFQQNASNYTKFWAINSTIDRSSNLGWFSLLNPQRDHCHFLLFGI